MSAPLHPADGSSGESRAVTQPASPAAATPPELPSPHLLFLGDVQETGFAKTAFGLRDWAPELCVGEYALAEARVSTGLPVLTPGQAHAKGARALVIGVANVGGVLAQSWIAALVGALEAGLDIVSGLHGPLASAPALDEAARRLGRRLVDVRVPPRNLPIATGRKRTGLRLLTVGTDCALGKKYTALAWTRAFRQRGLQADFRATGQTGIMIAGAGIPMDAVISDFEAGAAELQSPAAAPDHWDVIEGQGSLFHPSYAGVSLGLLHGSQPDVIVVCHQPGRRSIVGLDSYSLPSLAETIEMNLLLGRRINPAIRCGGISLNTAHLDDATRACAFAEASDATGLPAADPMRAGGAFDALVSGCLVAVRRQDKAFFFEKKKQKTFASAVAGCFERPRFPGHPAQLERASDNGFSPFCNGSLLPAAAKSRGSVYSVRMRCALTGRCRPGGGRLEPPLPLAGSNALQACILYGLTLAPASSAPHPPLPSIGRHVPAQARAGSGTAGQGVLCL